MKFLADEMLGKLAKWLRFLGYDTVYRNFSVDKELEKLAREEGRIILTRDTVFFNSQKGDVKCIFIKHNDLKGQLIQVKTELNLRCTENAFKICSNCNGVLQDVEKDFVKDKVPPYITAAHDRFKFCTSCGKIYWDGTHTGKIANLIKEIFG